MQRVLSFAFLLLCSALIAAGATFPQCPAVDYDTSGCEFLITVTAVNSSGSATAWTVAVSTPDLGPFDGSEDTLIGIVNSSGQTLNSITLSVVAAGDGIFDFDGDGACPTGSYTPGPTAAQCGTATQNPTGYGSAGTSFTGISGSVSQTGTVVMTGGLANGASTWFDLEGPLTPSALAPPGTTPPATPAPPAAILLLLGLSALGMWQLGRRFAGRTI